MQLVNKKRHFLLSEKRQIWKAKSAVLKVKSTLAVQKFILSEIKMAASRCFLEEFCSWECATMPLFVADGFPSRTMSLARLKALWWRNPPAFGLGSKSRVEVIGKSSNWPSASQYRRVVGDSVLV